MTPKKRQSARAIHAARKPPTSQRTYRFNTELFERFEEDCARHLTNPKLVLEALILYWLDSEPKARGGIALRHRERFGATADEE